MTPLFLAALGYCVAMRIAELRISASHEARVIAAGGYRVRPDGTGALVAVHTGWFVWMLVEQFVIGPTALPGALVAVAWALALGAEVLRIWCMVSLGVHWNVAVVVQPGAEIVRRGPYRWIKHPNYTVVVVLLVALPLALGLVWTAALVLPFKLAALRLRIRIEDDALANVTTHSAPA